ncbi:MAG: zinc-dependent peptidase [Acidimicrobiales bacterium]
MRFFGRHEVGLGDGDMALVARTVSGWAGMSESEHDRMADDPDYLLRSKRWEAVRGFELTQAIRVHIAAQASLLLLGLNTDFYYRVHSIVVHPTRMVRSGVRAGPVPGVVSSGPVTLLGEAATLGSFRRCHRGVLLFV